MKPVERYLDRVLAAARLSPRDCLRVRAELKEHLMSLMAPCESTNPTEEEITEMIHGELGDPEQLGRSIAAARGDLAAWLKRIAKRAAVAALLAALFLIPVRVFAVGLYRVAGNSILPCAARGDYILVNYLGHSFSRNDLVVYREGDVRFVAIVTSAGDEATLKIRRDDTGEIDVPRSRILGRVVLQTR